MHEALITRLRADAGIAAAVGTYDSRPAVDWIERPNVLPALTLQEIAPGRDYTHAGAVDLTGPLIQFDCWGNTFGESELLSRAVIAEMEAAATVASVDFDFAFVVSKRATEPEDIGGGVSVHRVSLDFRVHSTPA